MVSCQHNRCIYWHLNIAFCHHMVVGFSQNGPKWLERVNLKNSPSVSIYLYLGPHLTI